MVDKVKDGGPYVAVMRRVFGPATIRKDLPIWQITHTHLQLHYNPQLRSALLEVKFAQPLTFDILYSNLS